MTDDRMRLATLQELRNLKNSAERFLAQICQEVGLTTLQMFLLIALAHQERMPVHLISRELGISPANASTMCKRLEQTGYLLRERSQEDERIVELTLTNQGRAACDYLDQWSRNNYQLVMERCPDLLTDTLAGLRAARVLIDQITLWPLDGSHSAAAPAGGQEEEA